jgi:hypothetical protein
MGGLQNALARPYGTVSYTTRRAADRAASSGGGMSEDLQRGIQGLSRGFDTLRGAFADPGVPFADTLDFLGGEGTSNAINTAVGMASPSTIATPFSATAAGSVGGVGTPLAMAPGSAAAAPGVGAGATGAFGGGSAAAQAPFMLNPATMFIGPALAGVLAGVTSQQGATAGLSYDPETGYSQEFFNRGDYGNALEGVIPGLLDEVGTPARGGDATIQMTGAGPLLRFDRDVSYTDAARLSFSHDDNRRPPHHAPNQDLSVGALRRGPMTPENVLQQTVPGQYRVGEYRPTYEELLEVRERK